MLDVIDELNKDGISASLFPYNITLSSRGISLSATKRNLRTKYGELKELRVPRNRDNKFHSAVIEYNKTIGFEIYNKITFLYLSIIILIFYNSITNILYY